MAGMDIKVTVKDGGMNKALSDIMKALKTGMLDVKDDLIQTSSGAAPHWKGILEGSHAYELKAKGQGYSLNVDFSVKEGDYDYAMEMHEGEYNLGEGSLEKPGGDSRLSGNHYDVGNHFMTRPLEGDKEAYRDHLAKLLQDKLRGGE